MIPEDPQVAALGHRLLGRRLLAGVFGRGRQLEAGVVDQLFDLLGVDAQAIDRAVGAQRLEELGEGVVVPLGELGGAVERNAARGGLGVGDVELDDVALGPAKRLHGDEAAVAPDHAARVLEHDEGLGLAEAGEAGADRGQVALGVRARVGGVLVQRRERNAADRERRAECGFEPALERGGGGLAYSDLTAADTAFLERNLGAFAAGT